MSKVHFIVVWYIWSCRLKYLFWEIKHKFWEIFRGQSTFKCINDQWYWYLFLFSKPTASGWFTLPASTEDTALFRQTLWHYKKENWNFEILSKIQASHSTAQYFKLAGGLAERVAAVLVIVIAVKRIITIIIIFIIFIVIAIVIVITINPMIRWMFPLVCKSLSAWW